MKAIWFLLFVWTVASCSRKVDEVQTLHLVRAVSKGDLLTADKVYEVPLTFSGPPLTGLNAHTFTRGFVLQPDLPSHLGRRFTRDFPADEPLREEMLEKPAPQESR